MKETEGSGASWSLEDLGLVLFLLTGKMTMISGMLQEPQGTEASGVPSGLHAALRLGCHDSVCEESKLRLIVWDDLTAIN